MGEVKEEGGGRGIGQGEGGIGKGDLRQPWPRFIGPFSSQGKGGEDV